MILVFDTETSGLLRPLPATDPSQPHIVQLAAHLYDGQWRRQSAMAVLVRPDGWAIEPEAGQVHGISTMRCERYGVSPVSALAVFRSMVDCAMTIVSYNLHGFDRPVIAAALAHAGSDGAWWQKAAPRMQCAAEMATERLRLPGVYGGYKMPSLVEAFTALCPGQTFDQRHDAEADLLACAAVYRALTEDR